MADNLEYDPGRFGVGQYGVLTQKLWPFLKEEAQVTAMKVATDLGHPAVEGIAEALVKQFGEEFDEDRPRQLVGHMVRQVMESEGYEIDKADVKVFAYPFTKATRYRRKGGVRWIVFRSSKNLHELCIVADRADIERAPAPTAGKWMFWTTVTTTLQASIGLQVMDIKGTRGKIEKDGYALHIKKRILRAG